MHIRISLKNTTSAADSWLSTLTKDEAAWVRGGLEELTAVAEVFTEKASTGKMDLGEQFGGVLAVRRRAHVPRACTTTASYNFFDTQIFRREAARRSASSQQ